MIERTLRITWNDEISEEDADDLAADAAEFLRLSAEGMPELVTVKVVEVPLSRIKNLLELKDDEDYSYGGTD